MTEQKTEKFKHIVRICNADLDGNKPISHAMMKIKGIKYMFSNAICKVAKVENIKKTGNLSADEVARINDAIQNPDALPVWLLNRNKDVETGEDKHLIGSDLDFTRMNDIKTMQKLKIYKGTRHSSKLPVRGQRTKSNFRKGKSLGVTKKGKDKKK